MTKTSSDDFAGCYFVTEVHFVHFANILSTAQTTKVKLASQTLQRLCHCASTADGIRSSSISPTLLAEHMAQTTWKLFESPSTPTADYETFTSRIACTLRNPLHSSLSKRQVIRRKSEKKSKWRIQPCKCTTSNRSVRLRQSPCRFRVRKGALNAVHRKL
jgi:hypothetical protein